MIQLLIKTDDFLLNRHLQNVLKKIAPKEDRDFNFDRLSAKQAGVAAILNLYKTAPMMASARTVVVDDLDALDKEDLDVLAKTINPKVTDCHLILIAEKIDKRTVFYKSISKLCEVLEFKKPYPNQIPQFVTEQAQALDIKLEPGVAQILVEAVGTDLMSLIQELEKLKIAIIPRTNLSVTDVRKFVASGLLENIFELTQTLAEKNLQKSFTLFHRFQEQGEPVIRTVSLIISHFRKLLLVKDAQNQKVSEPLEKILGVHPFFVKDYTNQAKAFTPQDLRRIFVSLLTLSENLRSSNMTQATLFENFLQSVCVSTNNTVRQ